MMRQAEVALSAAERAGTARALRETRDSEGVPKYLQLARILKDRIARREYAVGGPIPTEEALCLEYGVSRITVREAVNRLVHENLLERKQGKGTFVLPPKLRRDVAKVYSFSHDMVHLGLVPESSVLELGVVEADPELAERLQLSPSDRRVTRIRRVRKANGIPILVETSCIPERLCPELVRQDLAKGSLYELLTGRYHLLPHHAEETHEAIVMDKADAKLLGCSTRRPQPAFAIRRVTYLEDGVPVEATESVGRGDRLTFSVRMVADKADYQRLVGI